MTAYWLTFKPRSASSPAGLPMKQLQRLIRYFDKYPTKTAVWWRCVSYKNAAINERVYFYKQGVDNRGIFGIGHIIDISKSRISAYDPIYTSRVKVKIEYISDPSKGRLLEYNDVVKITGKNLPNARASGNIVSSAFQRKIDKKIEDICNSTILSFDPFHASDERAIAKRQIYIRLGQSLFRNKLLNVYQKRCAFTGCSDEGALEAAHIRPYIGPKTNSVQNGILLRADIHRLFDLHLISINPKTQKIVVSKIIKSNQYKTLAGTKMLLPVDPLDRPNFACLKWSYMRFRKG